MIEEADFQKIGNAAIDLCVFVEKLRLGKKHREEANKLTHNVLNLIKQTEKIKEEPLTKGRKMSKKLKIKFITEGRLLKMQVLEFSGRYSFQPGGFIHPGFASYLGKDLVTLGSPINTFTPGVEATRYFESTAARKQYLANIVTSITNELFTRKGKPLPWEECEFRDHDTDEWIRAIYVGTLPEKGEMIGIHMSFVSPVEVNFWKQVRPLTVRVLPDTKRNGNEITYTWEEK